MCIMCVCARARACERACVREVGQILIWLTLRNKLLLECSVAIIVLFTL
jgi:hypothetical protein